MVEDDKTASSSDRDRKMMGSFEWKAAEDEKDKKEEKKKVKKAPKFSLFEVDKDEVKPEKNDKADDNKEKEEHWLENLSDSEKSDVVGDYAHTRLETLGQEIEAAQPESIEETVALANAVFLEELQNDPSPEDEAMDEALEHAALALGLELDGETEDEAAEDEPEDDPAIAATTTTPPPARPPVPPITPTPLVVPPTPPMPPTPPVLPGSPASFGPPSPAAPNVMPAAPPSEIWTVDRHRGGDMLLGGAIGYLIGRRRGRIKAEHRLEPIQHKLEKEVKTLQDKVAERETKIRRLAAIKATQQPEAAAGTVANVQETRPEQQHSQTEAPRPPEAPRIEEAPVPRPEALGRFALPSIERGQEAKPASEDIDTLTVGELLAIAQRIERDGVTVKEMYAQGRLDAKGLRRIVGEYLQGDHLDRVMAENLRPLESFEGRPLAERRQTEAPVDTGTFQEAASHSAQAQPPAERQYQAPDSRYDSSAGPTPSPFAQPATANHVAIAAGIVGGIIILLLIALIA